MCESSLVLSTCACCERETTVETRHLHVQYLLARRARVLVQSTAWVLDVVGHGVVEPMGTVATVHHR